MEFTESSETYLKEIFRISETSDCVRCTDVADKLKVTMSSVNRAVRILSAEGYLKHEPYGLIFLTEAGIKKAGELCSSQETITKYLMKTLFVDRATAFDEACKIEHFISPEIVNRMKELFD